MIDVATGTQLQDVVPGVRRPTAGGSIEWTADGKGFYYTRYPAPDERPAADQDFYQMVWFHRLGAPVSADEYVIGRELPRIAEISLHGSRDGNDLIANVETATAARSRIS